MEAVRFSEMSINFYQTTRRHVLEDNTIHRDERVSNTWVAAASLRKPFQSYSLDCENVNVIAFYFRYDDYVNHFSSVFEQIKTCYDRGLPKKETHLHLFVCCTHYKRERSNWPTVLLNRLRRLSQTGRLRTKYCSTDKLSNTVANRSLVTYVQPFYSVSVPSRMLSREKHVTVGRGDRMQHWEQD
jgi:hypothetical protein